jgi:ketosteroid isomerase-like protein
MDQGDSTDVLRVFMTEYGEAWNADDVDVIMNAYAAPCFVVKGGRAASLRRILGDVVHD